MPEPMIPLRLIPPAHRRSGVISVTVPSRGREAKLADSLRSLLQTAHRPDLIEILVAYDPDDPDTKKVAVLMNADVIWEAPERYGYARSGHYWAELLNRSTGEWVLPTWSDDAIMKSPNWDDMLRAQPPGSIAYLDGNYPGLTCFPAVHADALGAIGRLAPLPALDTWFEYAGRDSGNLVHPGIYVHQDRPDLTGCEADQTHAEGGGAWRSGAGGTVQQAFYQMPYVEWRAEDTMALRHHRQIEEEYQARMGAWSDIIEQMPLIRQAARSYWKPVIGELGTRTGESTSALIAGASASGGHVYSVDLDMGDRTGAPNGFNAPPWWCEQAGLWSALSGNDLGDEAAAFIPAELDILFIDTSHLYQHTLDELAMYVPRVKPGGTVLMHDVELTIGEMVAYGEPGAREDTYSPEYPVAAALDFYCSQHGLTWTRQTERPSPVPGRPFFGLGTIVIPGGGDAL
jgi:predicted O-methyltransferase YrrM